MDAIHQADPQLPALTVQEVGREVAPGRSRALLILGPPDTLDHLAWLFGPLSELSVIERGAASLLVRQRRTEMTDHNGSEC